MRASFIPLRPAMMPQYWSPDRRLRLATGSAGANQNLGETFTMRDTPKPLTGSRWTRWDLERGQQYNGGAGPPVANPAVSTDHQLKDAVSKDKLCWAHRPWWSILVTEPSYPLICSRNWR